MESILSLEPKKLTYVGIGSCPHTFVESEVEAKYDQLIPPCFHENLTEGMLIIHFDPAFKNCSDFLHQYFEKWGLIPVECEGGYHWIGECMEVILIWESINHDEHYWFFESLCDKVLQTGGKLVIQEYTGYSLENLNKRLYQAFPEKELFKRRILLDMTFETDSGCCTDMTKAQPFYDSYRNFLNVHFCTPKEITQWAGKYVELDIILVKKYKGKFLQSLNDMHCDYRRKLKGETLLFGSEFYSDDSTPDEIMRVLQGQLTIYLDILVFLRVITQSTMKEIQKLFEEYKTTDPYAWYQDVRKHIP